MSNSSWYRIENAADAADAYIYDEITHFGITADMFVGELNAIDAPAINLHLNTPGGYVDDGIAIYNALKNHPATVTAYVEGIAASIGSVIAMAADKVVMAPHSRMMIHEAHAGVMMGNAADFLKHAARLEAASQNIATIYAERAGDADTWRAAMLAETWYSDAEAVAVGLADEIGRSNDARAANVAAQQIAQFDLSRFRDGERIAARLVAELAHGDVLPSGWVSASVTPTSSPDGITPPSLFPARALSFAHGCPCGGGENCPASAPPSPETNALVEERDELEAALAAVRIGAY